MTIRIYECVGMKAGTELSGQNMCVCMQGMNNIYFSCLRLSVAGVTEKAFFLIFNNKMSLFFSAGSARYIFLLFKAGLFVEKVA
jgi:hypothetical protein